VCQVVLFGEKNEMVVQFQLRHIVHQEDVMRVIYALIFLLGLGVTSCQKKKEEQSEWGKIVDNYDEEIAAEWKSPIESDLLSGSLSPEEKELSDSNQDEFLR